MASTVKTLTTATGLLTFAANAVSTNVVTIAGVAYTYVAASPDPGAHELVPGATTADTVTELISAVNGGVVGMPRNPHVFARATAQNNEVEAVSRFSGTVGNFITTASNDVDLAWGAAVLENGAGDAGVHLDNLFAMNQINAEVLLELHKLSGAVD